MGSFLHLRSVDPAGIADEERAQPVVLGAGDVAGFRLFGSDSTAALTVTVPALTPQASV